MPCRDHGDILAKHEGNNILGGDGGAIPSEDGRIDVEGEGTGCLVKGVRILGRRGGDPTDKEMGEKDRKEGGGEEGQSFDRVCHSCGLRILCKVCLTKLQNSGEKRASFAIIAYRSDLQDEP